MAGTSLEVNNYFFARNSQNGKAGWTWKSPVDKLNCPASEHTTKFGFRALSC